MLWDQNWRDFGIETTGFDGRHGFVLRLGGEGVLGFTGNSIFFDEIFGCDVHMVVVEGIL